MKPRLVLLFLLLSMLTFSCIPYKEISIEYYDPPEVVLPVGDSSSILVVSNLYHSKRLNIKDSLDWSLDSVAASEAVNAMANIIEQSPYFSGMRVNSTAVYRQDTSMVIMPLSWSNINNLSERNNSARLIISMEYIKVKPYSDYYPFWRDDIKNFYGYLSVPVYCFWRVYNVENRKIEDAYLYKDTLDWDAEDWVEVLPGKQLPGIFEAAAYAGASSGEVTANRYASTWQKDVRILYVKGSEEMEKAAQLAQEGKWMEAASIWQELLKTAKPGLRAKAAFNLALANEMFGNFRVSADWLDEAEELNPTLDGLDAYKSIISKRMKANNNINK
ncbi:MAG: tetratricopeptide repeat protein [Bacteroidales bacterium]|nr:tetratricopeptide repeat protein [Bacteroidales bacterium]HPD95854.1 DUF6340 family protein [Tenuifilaceae bacterium]